MDEGIVDVSEVLLVRVEEAARRLGLRRSAAYVLIQRGELRSVKIGGARRVAVADLDEFVERLRAGVAEEVDV